MKLKPPTGILWWVLAHLVVNIGLSTCHRVAYDPLKDPDYWDGTYGLMSDVERLALQEHNLQKTKGFVFPEFVRNRLEAEAKTNKRKFAESVSKSKNDRNYYETATKSSENYKKPIKQQSQEITSKAVKRILGIRNRLRTSGTTTEDMPITYVSKMSDKNGTDFKVHYEYASNVKKEIAESPPPSTTTSTGVTSTETTTTYQPETSEDPTTTTTLSPPTTILTSTTPETTSVSMTQEKSTEAKQVNSDETKSDEESPELPDDTSLESVFKAVENLETETEGFKNILGTSLRPERATQLLNAVHTNPMASLLKSLIQSELAKRNRNQQTTTIVPSSEQKPTDANKKIVATLEKLERKLLKKGKDPKKLKELLGKLLTYMIINKQKSAVATVKPVSIHSPKPTTASNQEAITNIDEILKSSKKTLQMMNEYLMKHNNQNLEQTCLLTQHHPEMQNLKVNQAGLESPMSTISYETASPDMPSYVGPTELVKHLVCKYGHQKTAEMIQERMAALGMPVQPLTGINLDYQDAGQDASVYDNQHAAPENLVENQFQVANFHQVPSEMSQEFDAMDPGFISDENSAEASDIPDYYDNQINKKSKVHVYDSGSQLPEKQAAPQARDRLSLGAGNMKRKADDPIYICPPGKVCAKSFDKGKGKWVQEQVGSFQTAELNGRMTGTLTEDKDGNKRLENLVFHPIPVLYRLKDDKEAG